MLTLSFKKPKKPQLMAVIKTAGGEEIGIYSSKSKNGMWRLGIDAPKDISILLVKEKHIAGIDYDLRFAKEEATSND